ncbi:NAD(P)H nitroreductase [Thalassotalea insulae]|uniref:Putative NAD(P)H nitroreductase n=1 Tax=Thalassotalea insulae TaxID=2056778 RepID=A0ABQ6GWK1_9GAMM|nr:NAD(P)H nitroreductase [Thalassotalea insulae]GLX80336.1 NAD(P)H nitroreductase [Thalassotalea insulae]
MNALELLLTRQSCSLLTTPAPSSDQLTTILTAGMRVPDHAALKPYHFTVVENEGLKKLSDIFVQAIADEVSDNTKLEKTANMPFRAPLIIVVSTCYQEHEKVPAHEQLITAGCAVQAMQMAAFALGYGAIWRTGELSLNAKVKQGLNIKVDDDITGFLYLGTPSKQLPTKETKFFQEKVSYF